MAWLLGAAAAGGIGHHLGKKHAEKKEAQEIAIRQEEQMYARALQEQNVMPMQPASYVPYASHATAPLLPQFVLHAWRNVTDLPRHFCAEIVTADGNLLNAQYETTTSGRFAELWEFRFVDGNFLSVMHVPTGRYLSSDTRGTPSVSSKHLHPDCIWGMEIAPSKGSVEQMFVLKNKYGVCLVAAASPLLRFAVPA